MHMYCCDQIQLLKSEMWVFTWETKVSIQGITVLNLSKFKTKFLYFKFTAADPQITSFPSV